MATPDFILELRAQIGNTELWLPGVTAVVVRAVAAPDGAAATAPAVPDGAADADATRPALDWSAPLDPTAVEVLVVQRADNGHWTPVTGIIDPREEPAVAGAREIEEEAAVQARAVRLLSTEVVGPVTYPNGDVTSYLDIAFAYEWISGEPHPADGENVAARFVRADALPPLNPRFSRAVARALGGQCEAHFSV